MRKIMITGALGFIGSNLLKYWLKKYPEDEIIIVDAKTYAARPDFVADELQSEKVTLELIDIRDQLAICRAMHKYQPEGIIHLAAESHVCRSIRGPKDFITTNVNGTFNLLEEFRLLKNGGRFLHVSTDEVFGSLGTEDAPWTEDSPLLPNSPYACSKAASDMLVRTYYKTYGLNAVITNCANNFGANQHEEKLIPRTIQKIMARQPMTIYGTGEQRREWLFVEDHCAALDIAYHHGAAGENYCVGGMVEMQNIEMIEKIHASLRIHYPDIPLEIVHTNDRPTDDFRYAMDSSKLMALGWEPSKEIDEQLNATVRWNLKDMAADVMVQLAQSMPPVTHYAEQEGQANASV